MTELEPGWLKRQVEQAEKDIAEWPYWMKRNLNPQYYDELEKKNGGKTPKS